MERYILDLTDCKTKTEFYVRIADCFNLPSYFGKNLDALADCLTEIPGPYQLIVLNIEEFSKNRSEYCDSFLELLADLKSEEIRVFIAKEM